MKSKNYFKLISTIGVLFIVLFVVVMTIEIVKFSPYNTGMPFFADRILEFLLPGVLFLIWARIYKNKFN